MVDSVCSDNRKHVLEFGKDTLLRYSELTSNLTLTLTFPKISKGLRLRHQKTLDQRWRTYGTRAQSGMRDDFEWHAPCS